MPMSRIVQALWTADDLPASAEQIVRGYVSKLRKILAVEGSPAASDLITAGRGYRLQTQPDALDLARFRDRFASAQEATGCGDHARAVALLNEALALWGGSALGGVPGDFAAAQRRYLETLRLSAFETKVAALVETGAYGEAEMVLEAMTDRHPFNERFRELRMLSLYRHGRQSDALAVYRDTQALLIDELGVDPGHGLQDLHERILRSDPSLVPTRQAADGASSAQRNLVRAGEAPQALTPAQLPADLRSFVGRDQELVTAESLVTGEAGRSLVVLTGMAGAGKTAFAVHWAHRTTQRFPDGQIYLDLRGYDPVRPPLTVQEALSAVFDSLGVPAQQVPKDLDRQSAYLRSLVVDKRLLFVFDNARSAAQVRPLLPGGDRCLVMVTSRNQLRGLTVLDDAGAIELGVLPQSDAVRLLARRLGIAHPDEHTELTELAELCARLPLAMAVIAARATAAPGCPLTAVVEELRDQQDALDAFTDLDKGVDLRSVFSSSVRVLSEPAAELFCLLATHQPTATDETDAARLAGRPLRLVRRLLAELRAESLIFSPVPGRYASHELVRRYAAELPQMSAAEAQWLDHHHRPVIATRNDRTA